MTYSNKFFNFFIVLFQYIISLISKKLFLFLNTYYIHLYLLFLKYKLKKFKLNYLLGLKINQKKKIYLCDLINFQFHQMPQIIPN